MQIYIYILVYVYLQLYFKSHSYWELKVCLVMKTMSISVLKCARFSFVQNMSNFWLNSDVDRLRTVLISFLLMLEIKPVGGDTAPLTWSLRFWIWADFIIQNQSVLRDERVRYKRERREVKRRRCPTGRRAGWASGAWDSPETPSGNCGVSPSPTPSSGWSPPAWRRPRADTGSSGWSPATSPAAHTHTPQ